jgi:hypothetical protein
LCVISLLKDNAMEILNQAACEGIGAIGCPMARAKTMVRAALGNGQTSGSWNWPVHAHQWCFKAGESGVRGFVHGAQNGIGLPQCVPIKKPCGRNHRALYIYSNRWR